MVMQLIPAQVAYISILNVYDQINYLNQLGKAVGGWVGENMRCDEVDCPEESGQEWVVQTWWRHGVSAPSFEPIYLPLWP